MDYFRYENGKKIKLTAGEAAKFLQPAPVQLMTEDEVRAERNARLAASDWVILRSLETNDDAPQEWLVYRQALRDLPQNTTDYSTIEWPVKPE